MNEKEKKVRDVVNEALNNIEVPSNFEGVWEEYNMKQKKSFKKGYKKVVILAAAIVTLSATIMGASVLIKRTDDIQIAFQDDSEVRGNWVAVDFVEKISDFNVNKPKCSTDDLYLVQLTFKANGQIKNVNRTDDKLVESEGIITWTKGNVINPQDKTASSYEIREIDGEEYMFMEWKSGDYTYSRLEKPYYYVLKRAEEIFVEKTPERHDDINIPFQENKQMLGEWKSVGTVTEIDEFDSSYVEADLFLEGLNVLEEGKLITNINGESYDLWSWSGNQIINPVDEVVMACTLKEIDGKTYMFMEWKSGDYIYRGMKPVYYVLEKQE